MDSLREIHEVGFIHGDLKLENILIETGDLQNQESSNLLLIDFGLSLPYCDLTGKHYLIRNEVDFRGDLEFASHNMFNRKT